MPHDDATAHPSQGTLGFRVVGGRHGLRRLVDWQAALAGHAACDPRAETDRECYLSAFTFPDDFRDYLAANGSTKGYSGPCGAAWLWLDLDDPDDDARALDAARRLTAGLVDRYAIDADDLLVFYSGAKGYHVGLPLALCGAPAPSAVFHRVARRFAERAAERLGLIRDGGLAIDTGVYDRVRLFRAPNSRHPKTGRYKRRIAFDELLALRPDAIARMADAPESFDLPAAPALNFTAVADWNAAAEAVRAADAARAERRAAAAGATLNRRTLDFIRDGAAEGDRHRLLYSAAANLAEFGAGYDLAFALLSEAALDSGLPPAEVARQVRCGVEGGRA
ncbi:DNA primase [Botrimarina sp.]|uniref:DNA primase n=1 Tax=Botrimarina sp. TaxID=2795802 RepID=UPI0032F01EAF